MNEKVKVVIVVFFLMMVTVYQIGQAGIQVNVDSIHAQQSEEELPQVVEEDEVMVNDSAIRIRVIPHANAYQDQLAKRMVRFAIDEFLAANEANMQTIDATRVFLMSNLGEIESRVNNVLETIQYEQGFEVTYGNHLFPEKTHNGEVFAAGYYESLVIRIGEGAGNNWWCFVNPGLCLGPNVNEVNGENGDGGDHWNVQHQTMTNTQTAIQTQNFTSYIGNFVGNLFGSSSNDESPAMPAVANAETAVEFDWFVFDDER